MTELRRTPLWDLHVNLNAKMVEFAGYSMPLQYSSIIAEHRAVRERVGIFDVSHMARFKIMGPDALSFLDRLVTNKLSKLRVGKAIYTPMCDESGGVIDDLVVYMLKAGNEQELMVVGNAANRQTVLEWLLSWKERFDGDFRVSVSDVTDEVAQIALQGPNSEATLSELLKVSLDGLYFYQFTVHGEVLISRTGYTGEDGFELYGPPELIRELFLKLIERKVTPCGLGARDTLRLEAGLPLYGNELTRDITPIEGGIGWAVKLDKDFVGKEGVMREPRWRTVGLRGEDRAIARKGYEVSLEGENVGVITSGTLSPTLNLPIAMARIRAGVYSDSYLVNVRGKPALFREVSLPFVPHRYKRKRRR